MEKDAEMKEKEKKLKGGKDYVVEGLQIGHNGGDFAQRL